MINKFLQLTKNNTILVIGIITLIFFLFAFFIAKKQVIFADGAGYFSYPYELFIKGNLLYESPNDSSIFGVSALNQFTNINKYPIGTGFFLTPAFLLGEIFNNRKQHLIFDASYQFFTGIFGIITLIAGLAILNRVLLRFFDKDITNITLITITFATNLFIYGSTDSSFSHIYSFFCINLFLLFIIKWHEVPNKFNSLILGLSIGLTILVRQSNITILILFLFYNIDLKDLKSSLHTKFSFYKRHSRKLAIIFLVSLLAVFPQVIYFVYLGNNAIIFSYGKESFDFIHPQFLNVLFNRSRGLILSHPLFILILSGFYFISKKIPKMHLGIVLFLLANFYIISSWWYSDYAIGFGHRGFTDFMGVFAILLASLLTFIKSLNNKQHRLLAAIIITLLLILNLVLSLKYIYL